MPLDPKIPDDEPQPHHWDAYKTVIVEGRGHAPIVEKYGITRQTSWGWCNKVGRWLNENMRESVANLKVGILKRLEHIYSEALEAHRGLKSDETTTVEDSRQIEPEESPDGAIPDAPTELVVTKRRVTKRTRHGDAAFLSVALQSVQQMTRLYEHEMNAQSSTDDVRPAGKSRAEFLRLQIDRMTKKLAREQARGTVPAAPGGGEGDKA